MSAPGDPNLIKYPTLDALSFKIYQIAWNIVQNRIQSNVPGADSYYDISIPAPNWADENKFVKQVGRIRFYNLDKDIEVELLPEYLVNIN